MCDPKSTFCDTLLPYASQKFTSGAGVWIDVFPIDGIEDDIHSFKHEVKYMNYLCGLQLQRRWGVLRLH